MGIARLPSENMKKISARWGALTRALLAYIQSHMFNRDSACLSACDWVESVLDQFNGCEAYIHKNQAFT